MLTKLFLTPPPALAVLAVAIFLSVLLNREASKSESLPVFLPLVGDFVYVELMGDGLESGVYQFYDGSTLCDVIKLTLVSSPEMLATDSDCSLLSRAGVSLKIIKKDQKIEVLHQGWMKASHRLAMAIPLHPDRMSGMDWNILPGVGETLAERIEIDRQENGDYGHLEALTRVKGIGKKRVYSWRDYF